MHYINYAHRYVSNLTANGMTDFHGALSEALRIVKSVKSINSTLKDQISRVSSKRKMTVSENLPSNVASLIIFLSDGEPTEGITRPSTILQSIREANALYNTPIFSLSFGNDADYKLLQTLSLQNQGFVRRIYEDSDTVLQLKNFYHEISVPLLSDVTFTYASDVYNISLLTNLKFGLLFDGADLVVSGRVDDIPITNTTASNSLEVKITGLSGSGTSVFKSPEYIVSKVKDRHVSFMERLWAYLTVSQLVQKDIAGNVTINNAVDSQEDSSEDSIEKIIRSPQLPPKERATALALKFGFVTPYTSMVVMGPPARDITQRPCSCAPLHKYIYDSSDPGKQTTCPCPSISVQELDGTCEHCISEIAEVVQTFFNQNGTMDCPSDCKRHMLLNIHSPEENLPLLHDFMFATLTTPRNITTSTHVGSSAPSRFDGANVETRGPLGVSIKSTYIGVLPKVSNEYRVSEQLRPSDLIFDISQKQKQKSNHPSTSTTLSKKGVNSLVKTVFNCSNTAGQNKTQWKTHNDAEWAGGVNLHEVVKLTSPNRITIAYKFAKKNQTISVQDYPCCMETGPGFCKLLKDCLKLPAMTDFQEFINSSIFCPQHFQGEFYIGVCCPGFLFVQ